MKKMFNRTKRSLQDWDGYDEREYDWDGEDEYYAEVEDPERMQSGEYDPEAGFADENGYYAEDGDGGEYFAGDGEYYEDREYYEDGEYYEDSEYYGDVTEDETDMYYAEDEYDSADDEEDWIPEKGFGSTKDGVSFWMKLQKGLANMTAMDKIILGTGAGVLILALIVGGVYLNTRFSGGQSFDLASVGSQLDGIETIGEAGLLAVADAQMARLAAYGLYDDAGYDEEDYDKEVTVVMELVSIQRDLKIKFVNQRTDKLIANVPFSVNVTDPDGNTSVWSDDDMDGIIYKTEITPGDYKIVMEPLDDERYARYTVNSASVETVEVRKTIAYQAVNVANEVKTESEVNASQEDTKINETKVESILPDTVEWVESKVISATYNEVAKSTIPDPGTLVLSQPFMRATETATSPSTEETESPEASSSTEPSTSPETSPSTEPSSSPETSPSTEPSTSPETSPSTEPSTSPETSPSTEPSSSPTTHPDPNLALSPGSVSVVVGGTVTAEASAPGIPSSGATNIVYHAVSANTAVATVSVDGKKITVKGVAAGETEVKVTVSYTASDGTTVTSTQATLKVTVAASRVITLGKTAVTVYIGEPVTINATVNGVSEPKLTVTSSDTGVATVAVDSKGVITITGVKAGSATISVNYTENGVESPTVTCAVTVKNNPKNDTTNKLKDSSGNQLYVNENGNYREAVYADYYTAAHFYVRGETRYAGWQTIGGKVYFFKADGTKVTGEQVIQGAKYTFGSDGALIMGSNGIMGIDVSKWNGTIDWNAVKNSGVSYVIIRCGYRGSSAGSLIEDPKFTANIKGATAAGLKVGIYFFTQAVNEIEAVEEASMVLNQVKNYTISYPIFLDVESSGGRADSIDKATRTAVCKAFCQTIQNAGRGYSAGIYANKTWLTTKIDASALSAYKIWLAQYASTPTYTGRYDLWQYRSTGKVSGISGDVDFNLSYLGY